MRKLCPIMSKPIAITNPDGITYSQMHIEYCHETLCRFWIQPFTIEFIRHGGGCAFELAPEMDNGLFRV